MRLHAASSPPYGIAVWGPGADWASTGGQERTMQTLDEAKEFFIELGEALGIEDVHYVVFDEFDGWTIEHPLSCRLSGEMAKCVTNKVVFNDCRNGPPEWVSFRKNDSVRYKLMHEEEYDNWRYDKVEA